MSLPKGYVDPSDVSAEIISAVTKYPFAAYPSGETGVRIEAGVSPDFKPSNIGKLAPTDRGRNGGIRVLQLVKGDSIKKRSDAHTNLLIPVKDWSSKKEMVWFEPNGISYQDKGFDRIKESIMRGLLRRNITIVYASPTHSLNRDSSRQLEDIGEGGCAVLSGYIASYLSDCTRESGLAEKDILRCLRDSVGDLTEGDSGLVLAEIQDDENLKVFLERSPEEWWLEDTVQAAVNFKLQRFMQELLSLDNSPEEGFSTVLKSLSSEGDSSSKCRTS